MFTAESIESGVVPPEVLEALRTLLGRVNAPYLELPGAHDGLGVCICTSYADIRRHVEKSYQDRLDSQPRVPASYHAGGGGRRRLPDESCRRSTATQTEPWRRPHTESAPEARARRRRRVRPPRPPLSRAICSSSDTGVASGRSSRSPQRSAEGRAQRRPEHPPATPSESSPCTWERAVRKPVGPIYGPEDLAGGWVTRRKPKRKADFDLPPAKRPATGAGGRLSSATETPDDDDDDVGSETSGDDDDDVGNENPPPVGEGRPGAGEVVSSIEGLESSAAGLTRVPTPVVPSSQDSASAHSASDGQALTAVAGADARAALHHYEVATGTQVPHRHRGDIVTQSLAVGGREAVENFRRACAHWRQAPTPSGEAPGDVTERHPALDRFSRAYRAAASTTLHRAVLNVLHRVCLAHLYELYLSTLEVLAPLQHGQPQQMAPPPGPNHRARYAFDDDTRRSARDQMFWACHPDHAGKPRCGGIDRQFQSMLQNAERWHALREDFSVGLLALLPPGANSWLERLPLACLPAYFHLIRVVNPAAVMVGEAVSSRVFASWQGEPPPKRLLRLEYLDVIDPGHCPNPLDLFEEVDVGCVAGGPGGLEARRAVTVPAGADENSPSVLDALFSSRAGSYPGVADCLSPLDFFDGSECT